MIGADIESIKERRSADIVRDWVCVHETWSGASPAGFLSPRSHLMRGSLQMSAQRLLRVNGRNSHPPFSWPPDALRRTRLLDEVMPHVREHVDLDRSPGGLPHRVVLEWRRRWCIDALPDQRDDATLPTCIVISLVGQVVV